MTVPRKEKECRKINKKQCRSVTEVVTEIEQDTTCNLVEEEECRTVTETLCQEPQYLTVLDSYGNTVGSASTDQDIDTYGAPLAPPLKGEGQFLCFFVSRTSKLLRRRQQFGIYQDYAEQRPVLS